MREEQGPPFDQCGRGSDFQGQRFYITDYRDKGYSDSAKADSASGGENKTESKPAEGGSDSPKPLPVKPSRARPKPTRLRPLKKQKPRANPSQNQNPQNPQKINKHRPRDRGPVGRPSLSEFSATPFPSGHWQASQMHRVISRTPTRCPPAAQRSTFAESARSIPMPVWLCDGV